MLFIGLFALVSLYGDVYCIRLKTDPIHKEDYRGMIEYVFRNAGPHDLIYGLEDQVSYYKKNLHFEPRAVLHPASQKLNRQYASAFDKIWVLYSGNMHERVNDEDFKTWGKTFSNLGFITETKGMKFGGDEALTMVYIFSHPKRN